MRPLREDSESGGEVSGGEVSGKMPLLLFSGRAPPPRETSIRSILATTPRRWEPSMAEREWMMSPASDSGALGVASSTGPLSSAASASSSADSSSAFLRFFFFLGDGILAGAAVHTGVNVFAAQGIFALHENTFHMLIVKKPRTINELIQHPGSAITPLRPPRAVSGGQAPVCRRPGPKRL